VHLAAEMFQVKAGVKFLHVPYRGTSLAVTGLLSGDTDLIFDTTASAFPRIKAGQVRPLGLTSAERDPALPEAPTVAEQGVPGYEVLFWLGLYAPKGTPPEVLKVLDRATQQVLAKVDVRERLAAAGVEPYYASGPDLGRQVAEETEMWADVIKQAGVTFD
jgi:tripartite-type tricarboxylate transporter receptor subunit TctC